MGTGRGQKRETDLQNKSDAAIAAIKPTPYEDYQNTTNLNLLKDLDSGKDVRDISGLSSNLSLYDNAASDDFSGLTGVGLLGNNALSGSNGNIAGLIGKQLASRRQQHASGDLYNSVQDARANAQGQGMALSQMEGNREMGKAGLVNQQYTSYLNRPRKPSIWETLLKGGLAAGASYMTGGMAGAGGSV